jgi:hypothetical protein
VSEWTLPGFTEVARLGAGGFGRVVLARHDGTGQVVAIKYLFAGGDRDAFRREAALLRRVVSPHVARLYDFVEAAGGAAIVMEAVPGVSLRGVLTSSGSLPPESALAVLKGSLLGLAAAHAAGTVHRDYKPGNVLVQPNRQSKLVDFGIALLTGHSGQTGGTPAYMAPEQWQGAPATPATDVYAATCVFFQCVTGARPYDAPTTEELRALHLRGAPPVSHVPEPLRPLVTRGMAKSVTERPAGAAEFVTELESAARSAYGQEWEESGWHRLATAAGALLAASPMAWVVTATGVLGPATALLTAAAGMTGAGAIGTALGTSAAGTAAAGGMTGAGAIGTGAALGAAAGGSAAGTAAAGAIGAGTAASGAAGAATAGSAATGAAGIAGSAGAISAGTAAGGTATTAGAAATGSAVAGATGAGAIGAGTAAGGAATGAAGIAAGGAGAVGAGTAAAGTAGAAAAGSAAAGAAGVAGGAGAVGAGTAAAGAAGSATATAGAAASGGAAAGAGGAAGAIGGGAAAGATAGGSAGIAGAATSGAAGAGAAGGAGTATAGGAAAGGMTAAGAAASGSGIAGGVVASGAAGSATAGGVGAAIAAKVAAAVIAVAVIAGAAVITVNAVSAPESPAAGQQTLRVGTQTVRASYDDVALDVTAGIVQVSGHPDRTVQRAVNDALRTPVNDEVTSLHDEIGRVRDTVGDHPQRDAPFDLQVTASVRLHNDDFLSVRYDNKPTSDLITNSSWESFTTVTVDLRTGRALEPTAIFGGGPVTRQTADALTGALDAQVPGGICGMPGTLALTPTDFPDRVRIAYTRDAVELTLVLSGMPGFANACGIPTVAVPYNEIADLVDPKLRAGLTTG